MRPHMECLGTTSTSSTPFPRSSTKKATSTSPPASGQPLAPSLGALHLGIHADTFGGRRRGRQRGLERLRQGGGTDAGES